MVISQLRFATFQCGIRPFTNGICFSESRKHNYSYLLNEQRLCDGYVLLLLMVLSTPKEFTTRQEIRKTWGSFASRQSDIRLAFILGNPESNTLNIEIKEESETYHDIVQKDFVDSYRNLSLKSESILHFSAFFCPKAQYVLKVDSDVFINVPLLQNYLKSSTETRSIIGCKITHGIPRFDKSDKWHIDPSEYPLPYYPNYAQGVTYLIPGIFTKPLFRISLETRLLSVEDIYITGILREKLSLPLRHNARFEDKRCVFDPCESSGDFSCSRHEGDELEPLWKSFNECLRMNVNNLSTSIL